MAMSLNPHFDPLVSLQSSPTPAPIGAPGRTPSLSSSDSSSRTVMPATRSHSQENMLAAQDATLAMRNRVSSQQRKKLRSKLTGLATPFHIDTRRCPQGVLPPIRLSSRTLIGKAKERQRVTNIDSVSNKSAIVHSLTLIRFLERVMPEALTLLSKIY